MKYLFDVAFLPTESLKKHDIRLVVDLLRASTQIVTFFDAGGELLLPVAEVGEALALKEKMGDGWKVMGERGGLPAPGFDFGNSPLELKDAGAPQNAVITTSNGTRALMRAAQDCSAVRVACARNAEAAVWDALCTGTTVGIICAGRNCEFSLEDSVCAGMLVEKLLALSPKNGGTEMELTDGAMAALSLWQQMGPDLTQVCMDSTHGRIIQELGFTNDVFFCAETDETAVVPRLSEYQDRKALVAR